MWQVENQLIDSHGNMLGKINVDEQKIKLFIIDEA
jgi:hypothetical protein